MEENIPNDGLEDFLKKSFEGYSESPSGDLWDKIEAGLEPVVLKPWWVRYWWAAAAAAVVAGVIICQHFYYKNELSKLSEAVELQAVQLQELKATKLENKPNPPAESSGQGTTNPESKAALNKEQADFTGKIKSERTSAQQAAANRKTAPEKNYNPGNVTETPAGKMAETAAVLNKENQSIDIPVTTPALSPSGSIARPETLGQKALQPLKTPPAIVFLPSPVTLAAVAAPATFGLQKGQLSIGLQVLPMKSWEKIDELKPDSHHGNSKEFNDETSNSGTTLMAGVAVEYGLGKNWSLTSGLSYRKSSFTSMHSPSFKFDDGKHGHGGPGGPGGGHGGGPDGHEHDFRYSLNTPAGVVDLTVRVEQVDTNQQIPGDEKIDLEIKTGQTLEYVSVPLGLQYRFGKGRLGLNLRGGVVANFLVRNDFAVEDIKSLNSKFKYRKDKDEPGGEQETLSPVYFDYMAGLGVDYALTKSLKVSLMPTFMGSLTSKQNDRFIQSSSYSAGLNGALTFSF